MIFLLDEPVRAEPVQVGIDFRFDRIGVRTGAEAQCNLVDLSLHAEHVVNGVPADNDDGEVSRRGDELCTALGFPQVLRACDCAAYLKVPVPALIDQRDVIAGL